MGVYLILLVYGLAVAFVLRNFAGCLGGFAVVVLFWTSFAGLLFI